MSVSLASEKHLAAAAVALGADQVGKLSVSELNLTRRLPELPVALVRELRQAIAAGGDPLGRALRYTTAPPISDDDLRLLSASSHTSPSTH